MKKVFFYIFLLLSIIVKADSADQLNAAWTNLMTATNAVAVIGQSVNSLMSSVNDLQENVTETQAELADLEDRIAEASAQAEKVTNEQALLDAKSDVMKRGMVNNIINQTDMSFVAYLPDGTTVSIAAQSMISMKQLFSPFVVGSLVCGVITIVPQVAGQDISSSDVESQACGIKYYLQFNMQGLNEPGYSYGALDYISVTRADINNGGNTRAQSISLDDFVDENELWAVDVTLNYVPTRGDGSTYIYPRFSTLYVNQFDEEGGSAALDPSAQTSWGEEVAVNESVSDAAMSYPGFTGDTEKFWGDVISVEG